MGAPPNAPEHVHACTHTQERGRMAISLPHGAVSSFWLLPWVAPAPTWVLVHVTCAQAPGKQEEHWL